MDIWDNGGGWEVVTESPVKPVIRMGVSAFDQDGQALFIGKAELSEGVTGARCSGEQFQHNDLDGRLGLAKFFGRWRSGWNWKCG